MSGPRNTDAPAITPDTASQPGARSPQDADSDSNRHGGKVGKPPPRSGSSETVYDAIVIGSGFGGSMMAHALVAAGRKVLMIERGDWVERGPANWAATGSMELTRHYTQESSYHVEAGYYSDTLGSTFCVGGPSVFYGGVSFRFRERDFTPPQDIVGGSGAAWPFRYDDFEPYYTRAEQVLNVSGNDENDPTRPRRSRAFPQSPAPLAPVSDRIAQSARALGCSPFPLPIAINYQNGGARTPCESCMTCDTFACAVEAKNDLATQVLPRLIDEGLDLQPNTVAVRLVEEHGRIARVDCYDKMRKEHVSYRGKTFVLSAGALASPHLLLASDLQRLNPGGHNVGRHLMRHCNAMVFGVFPREPSPEHEFHKQLAIHDFYFGDEDNRKAPGKLGCIQQVMTPPAELVKMHIPRGLKTIATPFVNKLTGLLCIAEDQPRAENRVEIDANSRDTFGLPRLKVTHRYSRRDHASRKALVRRAKQILRRSGALAFHTHHIKTFSHAVGTVRMGTDPNRSALNEFCQFRGVDNLYVVDGSFMPSAAGVNPSLTISANALRVGDHVVHKTG